MRFRFVALIVALIAALPISALTVSAPFADRDTPSATAPIIERPVGECAACV